MDILAWVTTQIDSLPTAATCMLAGLFAFLEAGIGLGVVIPGELVVLTFAAAMTTPVQLLSMFLAVMIGASAGDHLGYFLGRRFGPRWRSTALIRRVGTSNWDHAVALVERHGAAAVFLTRLLPVVRTLTPAAAGVSGLTYRRFLPASVGGAALWSALFVGVGFLLRGSLAAGQKVLGDVGVAAVLVIFAGLAVAFAVRGWRSRRRLSTVTDHSEFGRPATGPTPTPTPKPARSSESALVEGELETGVRPSPAATSRRRPPESDDDRMRDRPSVRGGAFRAWLVGVTKGQPWRTIPNYITFARLLLLPILFGLLVARAFLPALILAVVVFASDFADGYIARRTDSVTALGTWLDPVADRIAGVGVAVGFGFGGVVPWAYVGLLFLPDVALGVLAAVAFRGRPDVTVTRIGKARTAILFVGFTTLLLGMTLDVNDSEYAGVFVGGGFLLALIGAAGHYVAAGQYAFEMASTIARRAGNPPE